MVERCALSGSDLKIEFRTVILLYCTVLYCTLIILYCIVLYSIKRDWSPCKVVFRVGNQNTKCDKQQQSNVFVKNLVTSSTGMYRASSV